MNILYKVEDNTYNNIKKEYAKLSNNFKLKLLNELLDKHVDVENKDNLKKLLITNPVNDMYDKFIGLLMTYSNLIKSYNSLYHNEVHSSGYAYDKSYRNNANNTLKENKEIIEKLNNIIKIIYIISITNEINYLTSHNISIGELIIDCYIYYDYQFSFNCFYQTSDYSLYYCVKTILSNKSFDWNNSKFLHKKYTNDFNKFKELLFKKSLLYLPFTHCSEIKQILNEQYDTYKITNEYNEKNIFIKYKYNIDIEKLEECLKDLNNDEIDINDLRFLITDNEKEIIVNKYVIKFDDNNLDKYTKYNEHKGRPYIDYNDGDHRYDDSGSDSDDESYFCYPNETNNNYKYYESVTSIPEYLDFDTYEYSEPIKETITKYKTLYYIKIEDDYESFGDDEVGVEISISDLFYMIKDRYLYIKSQAVL